MADDGVGMPPDVAERVFEPFYKAGPANADGTTGLGLSIVAGIVRAHEGTIEVQTVPGEGSRFIVRLASLPDEDRPHMVGTTAAAPEPAATDQPTAAAGATGAAPADTPPRG